MRISVAVVFLCLASMVGCSSKLPAVEGDVSVPVNLYEHGNTADAIAALATAGIGEPSRSLWILRMLLADGVIGKPVNRQVLDQAFFIVSHAHVANPQAPELHELRALYFYQIHSGDVGKELREMCSSQVNPENGCKELALFRFDAMNGWALSNWEIRRRRGIVALLRSDSGKNDVTETALVFSTYFDSPADARVVLGQAKSMPYYEDVLTAFCQSVRLVKTATDADKSMCLEKWKAQSKGRRRF